MDEYNQWNPEEPNALGMLAAKVLRGGKNLLNMPGKLPASVPLLGGMGAGDMLLGQAPEAIEDYSTGGSPLKGAGWATKVDPRVIDIAGLPVVGIGGIAPKLLRKGGQAAVEGVANVSRREALKKLGAGAGVAAAASVAPELAVKVLRSGAKEAAPIADAVTGALGKEVATTAASVVPKAFTRAGVANALKHYAYGWGLEDLKPDEIPDHLIERLAQEFKTPEELENWGKLQEHVGEKLFDEAPDRVRDPKIESHNQKVEQAMREEMKRHPDYDEMAPFNFEDMETYKKIRDKYLPKRMYYPFERAEQFLSEIPREELNAVAKSGKIPDEWKAKGVDENLLANELFNLHRGPRHIWDDKYVQGDIENFIEDVMDERESAAYRATQGKK